jgi:hypothetical protein
MVHALKEAWRVTRSTLLDIRPMIEPPSVWVRDRAGRDAACGGLLWKGGEPYLHGSANAALAAVVEQGLFTVEVSRQFEWFDLFENLDEMVETVAEEWDNWSLDEDTSLNVMRALEASGRGATLYVKQNIQAQVLRKSKLV